MVRSRPAGRSAAVYNIRVHNPDGEGEYFANGVLVHNCDLTRYLVMQWLGPVVEEVKPRALTVLEILKRELDELDEAAQPADEQQYGTVLRQG